MRKPHATNSEKLEIIQKSTLFATDIAKLLDCGKDKAQHIRTQFLAMHEQKYGYVPALVSTDIFIKWFGLDIKRIERYAEQEKSRAQS